MNMALSSSEPAVPVESPLHDSITVTPNDNAPPSIHNELAPVPQDIDEPSRSSFRTWAILTALYVRFLHSSPYLALLTNNLS